MTLEEVQAKIEETLGRPLSVRETRRLRELWRDPPAGSTPFTSEDLIVFEERDLPRLVNEVTGSQLGDVETDPVLGAPISSDPRVEPFAGQDELNQAVAAEQDPTVQITPEQESLIADAPASALEDADAFIAAIDAANEGQFQYDWVYQFLAPGSLDSNEALIELYESFVVNLENVKDDPSLTDDEKVKIVKELLIRGPNPLVESAVQDWGTKSGNYIPTMETDGVNELDILAIMDNQGVDRARAINFGRVALLYDLKPRDLAELWDNYGFKDGQTVAVTKEEQLGGEHRDFRTVKRGLGDIAQLYKQGLGLYDQSHLLAAIHISEPTLAQRLRTDPYSLDSGDLRRALDYIGGGEGQEGNPQINWIQKRLAGGFKGSGTVDKEEMRNAVQVLADRWNLIGTEQVSAALTSELVADAVAKAQASLPNPFGGIEEGGGITDTIQDQAAHVKARLRETPEYKELFGHLAGGESEEEFVRRFDKRSQEVFGDDVVGAVRNAMRTGNVNTIFQQGLNTPVGDSSTRFQEILAQNAQVFRDML